MFIQKIVVILTTAAGLAAFATPAIAQDCFDYCHERNTRSASGFADCYNGLNCGG